MDRDENIQTLLSLRKVTRAIADVLRSQMLGYLGTLTPLLRAKAVLGDYVQGGAKEPARKADKAFKDLQAAYESIAVGKPFNLPREIKPPIDVSGAVLEVTPAEYLHHAEANGQSRTIRVRSPLSWVLSYEEHSPEQFRDVLHGKSRSGDHVQRFVLSYLAIHVVAANQPGVLQMLEALHFPVHTTKTEEFGDLPVTVVSAAIATSRPSDAVMIETAELTGMDAFEEVINVQDIVNLRDPQKDRLLEIVRGQAPQLLSGM